MLGNAHVAMFLLFSHRFLMSEIKLTLLATTEGNAKETDVTKKGNYTGHWVHVTE